MSSLHYTQTYVLHHCGLTCRTEERLKAALTPRSAAPTHGRNGDGSRGKEEVDSSHLIGTEEASKICKEFRRAEKRRNKLFVSSSSYSNLSVLHPQTTPKHTTPTRPRQPLPFTLNSRPVPLWHRLRFANRVRDRIGRPLQPVFAQRARGR